VNQSTNINGIYSIIKHYYNWQNDRTKPAIKKYGCLIIEDFSTYLFSNEPSKINEYDLRFDLVERCKLIDEYLTQNNSESDKGSENSRQVNNEIETIKAEIQKMSNEYIDYIKEEIIKYFNI